MMRIGVLGTGNIGGTLGRRWAETGHEVYFGSRHPTGDAVRVLVDRVGVPVQTGDIAAAVAFADVILLAVPASAAYETVMAIGDWHGKVLIDATNRLSGSASVSLTQEIVTAAPDARVVKAFNTSGWETFADPQYGTERADLYLCGDDANAKATVATLAGDIGLVPVDVGELTYAPLLDALTRLWIAMIPGHGRAAAFKLLSR